ncbi:hypothetical protein MPTK1_3g17740 [Marchantia polymorpha subsp. ruderalis]|uniref:Glycosyltransferase 61 catalytic domain-containing protein n=2 Tax=Marchantia polymorpha TaxID=3197 RepID=A0AAF6B1Y5_MARPO|nr:hypothetical protein MARPO_0039s0022 [Marchantia polymorpha]BBN06019.1 hypothetical protein Mp_3g17740 [Marchantia polymorpha subsp. ruderalis]|eukprot:PTQ40509.1 hypothetical protein MARPO_0039s0022 [Marchantia polymorpha]
MVSLPVSLGEVSTTLSLMWTSRICSLAVVLLVFGLISLSAFYNTLNSTKPAMYKISLDATSATSSHNSFASDSNSSCFCPQSSAKSHGSQRPNHMWEMQSLRHVTVEEAYFQRMRVVDVSQIEQRVVPKQMGSFKSRFLPNDNFMEFPILAMENVCLDPSGALVLVETSTEEIMPNISGLSAIPELYYLWNEIYNCTGNISTDHCVGVTFSESLPPEHSYIPGNTAHFLAYIGNPMHNWAERTWPFVMASSPPIQSTVPYPIHHYIIHRFDKWLYESRWQPDRAQMLWQFRMLMEISGDVSPGYLIVRNQTKPVCFQKLLLQMHSRDRIDETRLPVDIAGAGLKKYREAIFRFFGIPRPPQVRLPPEKLRVLFYGRNDTSRRRVRNSADVINFLRGFTRPRLEVRYLDEMLASGQTNYSFPEVVRLFTQTDILVIAHGANTWATFLLPDGAGVVEIIGPCNWSSYNYTDLSAVHTWMHVNAAACKLKHDLSNPFEEVVPNIERGNTTECLNPYNGVPDYTIDLRKLGDIIHSFAYPDRPGDHLTQHWLYDWDHPPP